MEGKDLRQMLAELFGEEEESQQEREQREAEELVEAYKTGCGEFIADMNAMKTDKEKLQYLMREMLRACNTMTVAFTMAARINESKTGIAAVSESHLETIKEKYVRALNIVDPELKVKTEAAKKEAETQAQQEVQTATRKRAPRTKTKTVVND